MLNHRNRLIAVAGTLATTGAVTLSGLTAAASAAPAAPAVSGTVHFQEMTTSATARRSPVIATGAFTAGGTDIVTGNLTDTFRFPGGTFKVTHKNGHGSQSINPKTCLFRLRATGTYKLSDGTGRYAGISGHGRFVVTDLAVGPKGANGKCERVPPKINEQEIQASGPVHL
jgi:hypothetical protein